MNKEEIDKWLDNEYGVSYTRLEELHDFLIERNMKYQDKIDNLQQENKQLKKRLDKANEILSNILVIKRSDGNYGAVKNTRKKEVYKAICMLNEILETPCRTNYNLLGDKK